MRKLVISLVIVAIVSIVTYHRVPRGPDGSFGFLVRYRWRWLLPAQVQEPEGSVAKLAHPPQGDEDDTDRHGHCGGPVQPLPLLEVADVGRVHAEDTRDSAQREEDNCHDGESVDGLFLVVLARLGLV